MIVTVTVMSSSAFSLGPCGHSRASNLSSRWPVAVLRGPTGVDDLDVKGLPVRIHRDRLSVSLRRSKGHTRPDEITVQIIMRDELHLEYMLRSAAAAAAAAAATAAAVA